MLARGQPECRKLKGWSLVSSSPAGITLHRRANEISCAHQRSIDAKIAIHCTRFPEGCQLISFTLNNVPTLFIQGFTAEDVQTILDFARRSSAMRSHHSNTILFIDTPPTVRTVEAIHKLTDEGYRVVFRDHHGCDGEPADEGDRQRIKAAAKLEKLLGNDCTISVRSIHPACSTLVSVGEFESATAIVADPDADGLTAAMKAAGISYPELRRRCC